MKRSRYVDFPGQISIFDYVESMSNMVADYTAKGERLTTLAREKFQRVMDRMSFSELEKKLFSVKVPESAPVDTIVSAISKGVIRPLLKAMTTFDETDEAYQALRGIIDFDFSLEKVDKDIYGNVSAFCGLIERWHKTEDQLRLTLREAGWPEIVYYGYRCYGVPKRNLASIWVRDRSASTDLSLFLSWLVVFTLYNRALNDSGMEDVIRDVVKDAVYPDTCMLIKHISVVSGTDVKKKELDSAVPAFTPLSVYKRPDGNVASEVARLLGLKFVGTTHMTDDVFQYKNREFMDNPDHRPYGYLIDPMAEYYVAGLDPVGYSRKGIGALRCNPFLVRYKEDEAQTPEYVPVPRGLPKIEKASKFYFVVKEVIHAVWRQKGTLVEMSKYYGELQKESRAKVWQEKKNIPQKVMNEMKSSGFNDHFGYVEIDESCDLKSVKKLSDEFSVFKDSFLSCLDLKQVLIRFRLLGNLRCNGVYFPSINCLCVDVRHPSSFIHELGHCIDYMNDCLSGKQPFHKTYSSYRAALLDQMPSEKKVELSTTKSKYNLDYYLLPTEVFARCMEMYVIRVLGQELSICKIEDELSFAYPTGERLMGLIEGYFEGLFKSLNSNESVDSLGLEAA